MSDTPLANTGALKGKTIFITGGSRGIGLEIAKKAAADGANVAIAAKTADPNPKLPGTIYSAAEEIKAAGGQALPHQVDIREEEQVHAAVAATAEEFGGIDILINNASAISLTSTEMTPMKRYDLMNQINTRGTFLTSQACIPFLKKAENPHILTLSPPLDIQAKWFQATLAYTIAKYGMSMCMLGMAAEFKSDGIACNTLWPRTAIDTMAIRNVVGDEGMLKHCRKPDIMADAAYAILSKPSRECTGNFFVDDEVLAEAGITDLSPYAIEPGQPLQLDFYLEDGPGPDKYISFM